MGEHIVTETIKTIVTLDTIELPENPTNGDMIKAMFPNLEWTGAYKDVDFYSLDSDTPFSPQLRTFRSWWNAPYKEGVTECTNVL